jgi:hypothetical protein
MDEEKIFDIAFEHEGASYSGWVNPADKLHDDGTPASFHVVLNNVAFGHVSYANDQWSADEWRPEGMAAAIGQEIEKVYPNISKQKDA